MCIYMHFQLYSTARLKKVRSMGPRLMEEELLKTVQRQRTGNDSGKLSQTWAQTIISNVPKQWNSREPQVSKLLSSTACFRGSLGSFHQVNAVEPLFKPMVQQGPCKHRSHSSLLSFCRAVWVSTRGEGSSVFYTIIQVEAPRTVMASGL